MLQDSVQDAASFNHNSSSRATAQKCLLNTLDEDPTSVLPAQAVIELSDEIEHSAEHNGKPTAPDSDELPTSTPASHDRFKVDSSRTTSSSSSSSSTNSEIELQASDAESGQVKRSSDSDPIPLSSAAAVVSPPMSPLHVAPTVAHPESIAVRAQHHQAQNQLLDSAMDIQPGTRDSQAERPETVSTGTVSDAAMLAASHAAVSNGVQEKGVRTAAAAAAAALAPEVDDVMWPALMRQEAEGGVLLIEALKRSLQSGGSACYTDSQRSIPQTQTCVLKSLPTMMVRVVQ